MLEIKYKINQFTNIYQQNIAKDLWLNVNIKITSVFVSFFFKVHLLSTLIDFRVHGGPKRQLDIYQGEKMIITASAVL